MRRAFMDFQRGALDEFGREQGRGADRHDLVVIAVDDQGRRLELLGRDASDRVPRPFCGAHARSVTALPSKTHRTPIRVGIPDEFDERFSPCRRVLLVAQGL